MRRAAGRALALSPLAFALVLAALLLGLASAQRVAEPAPDFRLMDARGEVVSLSDYRGTPVVLNFWATWCPPCLEELPLFQRIADELGDGEGSGEVVVFLLLNYNEDPALAAGFLESEGITLRAALEPTGAQREAQRSEQGELGRTLHVLRDYRVRGMPTTVFIDAEGIIRSVKPGLMTPAEASERLATIGVAWEP